MKIVLRDRGFVVNHKKVYRLMCELGVQSIIRKKLRVWKNRISLVFDNVVERNFKERTENEVFVKDITYLPTKNGFRYSYRTSLKKKRVLVPFILIKDTSTHQSNTINRLNNWA